MKRKNILEKEELSPYYLAKFASRELLVEELVASKQGTKSYYLEKYIQNPFRLKLKVILTKLFFAFIFGIIPVLPLLNYFEIVNLVSQGSPSIEIVYFGGGLLFSLYFSLQFLNFFIMGMLDTVMIISGEIFEWFETLPISRKKYLRIVYLTLFRSYDLPIIVLVLAFPIIMLIGSQNIVIFFVCLGISFVNMVLSFSILIIFGERINRILAINDMSSKKTFIIRLINILCYIFIILSSYVLIQWFFSSLATFYTLFTASEYQSIINIIMSLIPFPFNPSFLISLFIAPMQASLQFWISNLIGFALLIIITYGISRKAFKAIRRISISKLKATNRIKIAEPFHMEVEVKVKSSRPFIAYLRKDLFTISRNLKVFMSIIIPIMLSFIYIVAFGIKNIETISLIDSGFFLNWVGILIFSPILSGLIVYSLMSIEDFGESIIAALPIIPRNQAKPKLLLIYTIQTCATLLPSLVYLNSPNFIAIFINFLFALPFSWLFLLIIFILRINFFGKKRPKFYVLEEYNPKNRLYKWILIITVPYILFFWIFSFGINFFIHQDLNNMMVLFWAVTILGFLISLIFFNIMLPVYQQSPKTKWTDFNKDFFSKEKTLEKKIIPTIFSKHVWLSIPVLLIINFFVFVIVNFFIQLLSSMIYLYPFYRPDSYNDDLRPLIIMIIVILIPNLLYAFLFFYVVPKYMGLPYGRQPLKQYLDCTGLSWLKNTVNKNNFKTILFICSSIFIIYFMTQIMLGAYSLSFYYVLYIVSWLVSLSFCFWQELLHRGIFLTMIIGKYSFKKAMWIQTILTIIPKSVIYLIFIFMLSYTDPSIPLSSTVTSIIIDLVISSFISLILGYVYLKKGSLLPGLISIFILTIFMPIGFFLHLPTAQIIFFPMF